MFEYITEAHGKMVNIKPRWSPMTRLIMVADLL